MKSFHNRLAECAVSTVLLGKIGFQLGRSREQFPENDVIFYISLIRAITRQVCLTYPDAPEARVLKSLPRSLDPCNVACLP
jgi:hypothetical protein